MAAGPSIDVSGWLEEQLGACRAQVKLALPGGPDREDLPTTWRYPARFCRRARIASSR
jgi:hypothetical protein